MLKKLSSSAVSRPVALITGGSSGIGATYARRFARVGFDLIVTGRREKLLEKLCTELESSQDILAGYVIGDLTSDEHLTELSDLIRRTPNLHVLVNNAGYTRLSIFHRDEVGAQIDMIKVHDVAAVRLTHASLPVLTSHSWGAVINVSSIAAFEVGARNLMYDATKAFLLNFSESLHLVLQNTGVRVQAVCPGFTRTDFHVKLGMDDDHPIFTENRFMTAEEVVDISLKCLEKNKVVCVPGWRNKLRVFLTRHAPRKLLYRAYTRRRGLGKRR